jgi:hypothetical protein
MGTARRILLRPEAEKSLVISNPAAPLNLDFASVSVSGIEQIVP